MEENSVVIDDNKQLKSLQNQIHRLPSSDVRLYFRSLKSIKKEISDKKDKLEVELSFQQSRAPLFEASLKDSRNVLEKAVKVFSQESLSVQEEVKNKRKELEKRAPDFLKKLEELSELERNLSYFKAAQKICEMNSEMKNSLETADWSYLLRLFNNFSEILPSVKGSSCRSLFSYIKDSYNHWLDLMNAYLPENLLGELQKFGWPFDSPQKIDLKSETVTRIYQLLEILISVWKCSSDDVKVDPAYGKSSAWSTKFPFFSLFLYPLEKRFRFHFYGNKKTNSVEKPEWFLTQIIQWIKAHEDFLDGQIQPIFDKYNLRIVAIVEFMRSLEGLAHEKLTQDMNKLRQDSSLFSHCIDEVVVFEMEMRALGYPTTEPNCLELFTEESLLNLWLQMERDCNTEKVEQLLTNEAAWIDRYQEASELDEFKVPECADEFLLLLQVITERYRLLRSTEAQYQFLCLQLNLLDDFRVRLVQLLRNVHSPWATPYPELMNAIAYITHVLSEWNDLPFFIRIQGYKYSPTVRANLLTSANAEAYPAEQMESLERKFETVKRFEGVFEGIIQLFQLSWTQMHDRTVKHMVWEELLPTLEKYKKEKWYAMGREGEKNLATNITASFCPFLLLLRERLTFLHAKLSSTSFTPILRKVAKDVSKMILGTVLTETAFTEMGAVQMQYDFLVALIPLVKNYGVAGVDSEFSELLECMAVLSLKSPTAVLLKDLVEREKEEEIPGLGKDFEVYSLKRSQITELLKKRVDLKLLR